VITLQKRIHRYYYRDLYFKFPGDNTRVEGEGEVDVEVEVGASLNLNLSLLGPLSPIYFLINLRVYA
jgi:hypothetical protein